MKFYRVHYHVEGGNSGGFSWHTSKRAANAAARQAFKEDPEEYADGAPTPLAVDIKPTRAGILAALERYADHADNG